LPRPIQSQAARGDLDRGLVGEHLLKMPFRVRQLGAKFKRERERATQHYGHRKHQKYEFDAAPPCIKNGPIRAARIA
jgi:hypothetical protein